MDDSIIDKTINTVLRSEAFTDEELIQYLSFHKKLHEFFKIYEYIFEIGYRPFMDKDVVFFGAYPEVMDEGG